MHHEGPLGPYTVRNSSGIPAPRGTLQGSLHREDPSGIPYHREDPSGIPYHTVRILRDPNTVRILEDPNTVRIPQGSLHCEDTLQWDPFPVCEDTLQWDPNQ